jgi:hypothetical protein
MVRTRGWSGLWGEGGDVGGAEDALCGPQAGGAVTDVAHERQAGVEGVSDGGLGGGGAELCEEELLDGARGEESGDLVLVGLEVSGQVGVVGDEGGLSGEGEAGVLEVEDLLDGGLGLGEGGGVEAPDGDVGERVLPLTAAKRGSAGVQRKVDLEKGAGMRSGREVPARNPLGS